MKKQSIERAHEISEKNPRGAGRPPSPDRRHVFITFRASEKEKEAFKANRDKVQKEFWKIINKYC